MEYSIQSTTSVGRKSQKAALKLTLYRVMCSIVMSRALVVWVNIGSFLIDVRLAILSIRKSAATNLAHLAYCIPAILDAAPIGFRFIDVSCSHVCHDDRSSVPAAPMD